MVEGNMGKFESQISSFQSGGEFVNACVLLRHKSIDVTPDPLLSLALLRDEQRLSARELVNSS
jgi:hypothetical protein